MQIISESYSIIDWDDVPIEKRCGEKGFAWSRSVESGNVRMMLVEYSPDFRAGKWCCGGQVIYVLDGEMNIELKDGSVIRVRKGMSCCFSDSKATAHRLHTAIGAFLLVID